MKKLEWEEIDSGNQRAKVFGGWIVKTSENVMTKIHEDRSDTGYEWRVATCFVPDADYEWDIRDDEELGIEYLDIFNATMEFDISDMARMINFPRGSNVFAMANGSEGHYKISNDLNFNSFIVVTGQTLKIGNVVDRMRRI